MDHGSTMTCLAYKVNCKYLFGLLENAINSTIDLYLIVPDLINGKSNTGLNIDVYNVKKQNTTYTNRENT